MTSVPKLVKLLGEEGSVFRLQHPKHLWWLTYVEQVIDVVVYASGQRLADH